MPVSNNAITAAIADNRGGFDFSTQSSMTNLVLCI
jgi:hypothetical protein